MPNKPLGEILGGYENGYAILQLMETSDRRYLFSRLRMLEKLGLVPNLENYEVRYRMGLTDHDTEKLDDPVERNIFLEGLFYAFNRERPADFKGHSLSVSDIVAIKRRGVLAFYFVDSVGFQELYDFTKPFIQIYGYKCHLVDEWDTEKVHYCIGSVSGSDGVFYYIKAEGSWYEERYSISVEMEYDHRPIREEVEEDYLDEISKRDIASRDL